MFGDAYLVETKFGSGGRASVASVTKLTKDAGGEMWEKAQPVDLSSVEYEPSSDFAHVVVSGKSRSLQVCTFNVFFTSKIIKLNSHFSAFKTCRFMDNARLE
jgi:hypothetical protein